MLSLNAVLDNFERISFNVGPTLLDWMVEYDPATCRRIVEQDRANIRQFGIGNAIAQAYNHGSCRSRPAPISAPRSPGASPISSIASGQTQGMWPQTAVDLETLAIMADMGIEFTLLAPWQADRDDVNPTEPYRVALPEGRSISVFFYHQGLSGRVSFDPSLTTNADAFALHDLPAQYHPKKLRRGEPHLLLVATDGELYGHHQPFRDLFLAHLLKNARPQNDDATFRPAGCANTRRAARSASVSDILELPSRRDALDGRLGSRRRRAAGRRTCARARSACGASTSARQTLHPFIADPWALRDRYIHVILGALPAAELIDAAAGRRLPEERSRRIHMLLKAQRERQRMFTSCGWFFDDFDRIEPKNNVAYAAQAVRLTRVATGVNLAPSALERSGTSRATAAACAPTRCSRSSCGGRRIRRAGLTPG